ncbi:capsular polysaccharide export protein, LipB/KpsS family [Mangrovimonas cancribranchiae]|uniref:Capsule polysaccharide biosynthesis protein n=1 Tax=Mangrovimonas cancribranchiae TaxID=3080055 RepID=A0AAU6P0U6_9FLAO
MKDLDKHAYDVVCNWYKAINFNPVHKGIDYSLIIRFYLWDKVGRALRIQHGIDYGEVEVYKKELNENNTYHYAPLHSKGNYKKPWFKLKKSIFIPYHVPHTTKLVNHILSQHKYTVLSKEITPLLDKKHVIARVAYHEDTKWGKEISDAVLEGLISMNVALLPEDKKLLKKQVLGCVAISCLAEEELKHYTPKALYVHSDNHPPYINYVLAAKALGIPTFTYQHGLDCEHYYYDDCFADYVAVWSAKRKEAYVKTSQFSPKKIHPIGNVFLDKIKRNNTDVNQDTLLFVTRPHSSQKCYAPSRHYKEGAMILKTILTFLEEHPNLQLIIKPHPRDYVQGYKNVIAMSNVSSRVTLLNDSLDKIIEQVSVVITEDTTAGIEAIRSFKPCVHAHFSKSNPVLPLVTYHAALPGFAPSELYKSLERSLVLSEEDFEVMMKGQIKFMESFMPFGSIENLYSFITNNIK